MRGAGPLKRRRWAWGTSPSSSMTDMDAIRRRKRKRDASPSSDGGREPLESKRRKGPSGVGDAADGTGPFGTGLHPREAAAEEDTSMEELRATVRACQVPRPDARVFPATAAATTTPLRLSPGRARSSPPPSFAFFCGFLAAFPIGLKVVCTSRQFSLFTPLLEVGKVHGPFRGRQYQHAPTVGQGSCFTGQRNQADNTVHTNS